MARKNGWRIILRIEDLDGPRIKAGADRQAIDDLRWLGLDWDQGPIYQSTRTAIYLAAAHKLLAAHRAYPCTCSRREAELASSAPHAEDGASVYPGSCRGRFDSLEQAKNQTGRDAAIRFEVPSRTVEFTDGFAGPCGIDVGSLGDFVIVKADRTPAYHLAVVIDDAQSGVSDIVRGDDLLDSAARQLLLCEAMGLSEQIPHYWHLPLVIGADGRRLAKRHGDTRLVHYQSQGVSPGRILSLLGKWGGVECDGEATLDELLKRFDLNRVPRHPIVFGPADEAQLHT
jgi:glutamyl-tRNA synthetase